MKGFIRTHPDSSRSLSKIKYAFVSNGNLSNYMALTLNVEASAYYLNGEYEKAIKGYLQAKKLYDEAGIRGGEGKLINNIGNVNYNKGDYLKAIEYYEKSLEIKEKVGDKDGQSSALNNIALV